MAKSDIDLAAQGVVSAFKSIFEGRKQVSYDAVIQTAQRDDLGRTTGIATAMIDGMPNVPIAIPAGSKVAPNTRVRAINYGSLTDPNWMMFGAANVPGAPALLDFVETTTVGTQTYSADDLLIGDPYASKPNLWYDVSEGQFHIRNKGIDIFLVDSVLEKTYLKGEVTIDGGLLVGLHPLGPQSRIHDYGITLLDSDGGVYFDAGAATDTNLVHWHLGNYGEGIRFDWNATLSRYQLQVDVEALFGSISVTQLNFTPVVAGNVIASINASTEEVDGQPGTLLTIDADHVNIEGLLTAEAIEVAWNDGRADHQPIRIANGVITSPTIQTAESPAPRVVMASNAIRGYTDATNIAYALTPDGLNARGGYRVDAVGQDTRSAMFLYRMKGDRFLTPKDHSGWSNHLSELMTDNQNQNTVPNISVVDDGISIGYYDANTHCWLATGTSMALDIPSLSTVCIEAAFTVTEMPLNTGATTRQAIIACSEWGGDQHNINWWLGYKAAGNLTFGYRRQGGGWMGWISTDVQFSAGNSYKVALRLVPNSQQSDSIFVVGSTTIAGTWKAGTDTEAFVGDLPYADASRDSILLVGVSRGYDQVFDQFVGIISYLRGFASYMTETELIQHLEAL